MMSRLLSVSIFVSWYKNSGTVFAVGTTEPGDEVPAGPMFATWRVFPSRMRLPAEESNPEDDVAAAATTAAAAAVAAADGGGNGNGGTAPVVDDDVTD
jgi:hypothetical protein